MVRRFNLASEAYRKRYGGRLQKLVLDAGFTCPNRDGTLGRGGCSFCDNAAFHPAYASAGKSLTAQIDEGIAFHEARGREADDYIAYFQSFSNTYAPLEVLKERYEEALAHPRISGIAIGTRPDCVDPEKLDYIASLKERDGGMPVFLEFGIESCRDETLRRVGRGHDFAAAEQAVRMASERGLDVGAHFIWGLPGETRGEMLASAAKINALPLSSVKFHQLQLLRGTRVLREYKEHPEDFLRFSLEEYVDFMAELLARLREDLLIDRIAGEVPPRFTEGSVWGHVRHTQLLGLVDARLEALGLRQGALLGSDVRND